MHKCHRLENAVNCKNSCSFSSRTQHGFLGTSGMTAACCTRLLGHFSPQKAVTCSHVVPVLAPSSWDVLSHPGVKELCCSKVPALNLEALGKVCQGGKNHRHMSLPKASCGVEGPQPALSFLRRGKRNQDVNLL